jgi:hypothetical protein
MRLHRLHSQSLSSSGDIGMVGGSSGSSDPMGRDHSLDLVARALRSLPSSMPDMAMKPTQNLRG